MKGRGRGMVKGDGGGKGDGEGKGDGQGGWSREGDGKEKGDGEGKGLPGPSLLFVGGPGPSSLSSHVCVSWLCHRWAMSPHCHHVWHGCVVILCWHRVIVGPCCLLVVVACLVMSSLWLVLLFGVVVLSLSCHCVVSSSLPSHIVIMPCVVLCLSKVCWEEWGMRGAHHGVLAMMTNDDVIHHLVATLLMVMWHLDLMSEK